MMCRVTKVDHNTQWDPPEVIILRKHTLEYKMYEADNPRSPEDIRTTKKIRKT